MNQYKLEWYLKSQTISPVIRQKLLQNKTKEEIDKLLMIEIAMGQSKEYAALRAANQAFKYAARNRMKGRLGMGLRVTGKVGTRFVPVVGWALFAYDVYSVTKWLLDD